MRKKFDRGGGRRSSRNRGKMYIYGKHALMEAIAYAPHVIRKVFLSQEASADPELRNLLHAKNIGSTPLKNSREADRMVGVDTAHQGVIAIADPSALMERFEDALPKLTPTEKTALVLLDELNDPHNVGAIIRSAVAFGASGILMPSHHQAPITGAVVKASAGMIFRIPIIAIGNVNQTVMRLQKEGFRAYALAAEGNVNVSEERFDAPSVFIVGNEAKGVREKTLEHSDVVLRIPIDARAESLNASVSAAVVLYAWSVWHPDALRGK